MASLLRPLSTSAIVGLGAFAARQTLSVGPVVQRQESSGSFQLSKPPVPRSIVVIDASGQIFAGDATEFYHTSLTIQEDDKGQVSFSPGANASAVPWALLSTGAVVCSRVLGWSCRGEGRMLLLVVGAARSCLLELPSVVNASTPLVDPEISLFPFMHSGGDGRASATAIATHWRLSTGMTLVGTDRGLLMGVDLRPVAPAAACSWIAASVPVKASDRPVSLAVNCVAHVKPPKSAARASVWLTLGRGLLVTAGQDGLVKIWDAAPCPSRGPVLLATLRRPTAGASRCWSLGVVTVDGDVSNAKTLPLWIVAGTDDGCVLCWSVTCMFTTNSGDWPLEINVEAALASVFPKRPLRPNRVWAVLAFDDGDINIVSTVSSTCASAETHKLVDVWRTHRDCAAVTLHPGAALVPTRPAATATVVTSMDVVADGGRRLLVYGTGDGGVEVAAMQSHGGALHSIIVIHRCAPATLSGPVWGLRAASLGRSYVVVAGDEEGHVVVLRGGGQEKDAEDVLRQTARWEFASPVACVAVTTGGREAPVWLVGHADGTARCVWGPADEPQSPQPEAAWSIERLADDGDPTAAGVAAASFSPRGGVPLCCGLLASGSVTVKFRWRRTKMAVAAATSPDARAAVEAYCMHPLPITC